MKVKIDVDVILDTVLKMVDLADRYDDEELSHNLAKITKNLINGIERKEKNNEL